MDPASVEETGAGNEIWNQELKSELIVEEQNKMENNIIQKSDVLVAKESLQPIVRKRGRPKKISNWKGRPKIRDNSKTETLNSIVEKETSNLKILGEKVEVFNVTKGKRGRPRKTEVKREVTSTSLLSVLEMKSPRSCKRSAPWEENDVDIPAVDLEFPKKKRGRPKKNSSAEISSAFSIKRVAKRPKKYSDTSMMVKNKYNKMKLASKVGRPRKQVFDLPSTITAPKRGRPRKVPSIPMATINDHKEDVSPATKIISGNDKKYPLSQLVDVCKQMYHAGWTPGKCGAASMKFQGKFFVASNVLKRETPSSEISVYDDIENSQQQKIKESDAVVMKIYQTTNAGAIVHCQSTDAVLASVIFKGSEFRITHQDVIGEIQNSSFKFSHKFNDILVIPIVHNALSKEELAKRLQFATEMNPDTNAVLVRRQGIYIWSDNLPNALSQAECYHQLFQTAIKMRQIGVEPDHYPKDEYGLTG
uniref:Methylthioribulose-1-phosphate dehydratase-like n=1 Tax=Phallusia mammillata TaxID=59560 RepID=A0A6F9D779_9ASCI|nr:methylthioribulose-1-phosphate dehydratase-like [Phallusia mammillata]